MGNVALSGQRVIFVGGLHKSGTSLTHRLLRAHPDISGFVNTGAPQDEGQHLQSVYPPARIFGGPGHFAFDERAHLTEQSSLITPAARVALSNDWARHWDLSKPLLIEKSPPNLIRARFLQALFPGATFIFVVRHPVAVSLATKKWSQQTDPELIRHWAIAHEIFLDDLTHLKRWAWIRYEDLVTNPEACMSRLWDFLRVEPVPLAETVTTTSNSRYLSLFQTSDELHDRCRGRIASIIDHFGYRIDDPYYRQLPGEGGLMTA
jgi:hypothetical protein